MSCPTLEIQSNILHVRRQYYYVINQLMSQGAMDLSPLVIMDHHHHTFNTKYETLSDAEPGERSSLSPKLVRRDLKARYGIHFA